MSQIQTQSSRAGLRWLALIWAATLLPGCSSRPAEPVEESPEPAPVSVQTAKAEYRTIHTLVDIDGSFVASEGQSAKLAPVQSSRILKVFVKEGDHVTAGQLLATVDTSVLTAQTQGAQAAAVAARASSVQASVNFRSSEADTRLAIASAESTLTGAKVEREAAMNEARAELNRLRAGPRPEEVVQAEQAVSQAQITRDRASQEAERDASLLKEGFVSGQQAANSKAAFALAESSLKQSEAQLRLLRQGTRKEEILAAQVRLANAMRVGNAKVSQAEIALNQANAGRTTLQAKALDASVARATLQQRQSDVAASKASERLGEIRAPFSGTVTRRSLNSGDLADPATPVLEVSSVNASIDFIGATDAGTAANLRAGLPVQLSNYPDRLGKVTSLGSANPQTGMIPVRVRFPALGAGERIGTFATAHLVLSTHAKAISVPEAAILNREDKNVAFLVADGVAKMTEVTVGATEEGWTEIVKGLPVGSEVVLLGQHELADGAKVKVGGDEPSTDKEK